MSLIEDIKAKADQSGDGKVSKDDLESMKDGNNDGIIDKLKGMADQNEDGRLSFDDIKSIDLGGTLKDIKGKIF